jgi:hypothetical protein
VWEGEGNKMGEMKEEKEKNTYTNRKSEKRLVFAICIEGKHHTFPSSLFSPTLYYLHSIIFSHTLNIIHPRKRLHQAFSRVRNTRLCVAITKGVKKDSIILGIDKSSIPPTSLLPIPPTSSVGRRRGVDW